MERTSTTGLTLSQSERYDIVSKTNAITEKTLNDPKYSLFSAMSDSSALVEQTVIKTSKKMSQILSCNEDEPYGVFLF